MPSQTYIYILSQIFISFKIDKRHYLRPRKIIGDGMARRKIPEDRLTEEQRKRRERNERYRNRKDLVLVSSQMQIPSQTVEVEQTKPKVSNHGPSRKQPVSNHTVNLQTRPVSLKPPSQKQITPLIQKKHDLEDEVPKSLTAETKENVRAVIKWETLFEKMSHPEHVFLGLCVLILSAYLTFQNFSFFLTMENRQHIALLDALISEFVLILLAASLAFCLKKTHRFLIGIFLISTIFGLGVFFHRSLSENFAAKSSQVEMLMQEKTLTTKVIERYMTNIEGLPENFVAKRQDLQSKLDEERTKLADLNKRLIESHDSAVSNNTNRVSYAFWLRLAAMLLNAYLAHCFFSRLKRNWSV